MARFLIIAFLLCTLFSCSKDEVYVPIYEPGTMEHGYATALKNGKEFRASALAEKAGEFPDSLFFIHFYTETEYGENREIFSAGLFHYVTGKYNVQGTSYTYGSAATLISAHYSTSQDDGDVSEDDYFIDSLYDNHITLISIDTVNAFATGTFDLSFNIKQPKRNPLNPDKVMFTQGIFEVDILD